MATKKLASMPKKTNTFRCISIFCNKGGYGKTTTAIMFGTILAAKGYKVLMIDNDGQSNLSDFIGAPLIPQPGVVRMEDLYWDINKNTPELEDKINVKLLVSAIQESEAGYGYIESSKRLDSVIDSLIPEMKKTENLRFTLWRIMQAIKNSFDFCIIDCPCKIDILSANSIFAADDIIVTMATDADTEKTLVNNSDLFKDYKKQYDIDINIDRVIPVKVKTPSHIKEGIPMIKDFTQKYYNSKISDTYIKYSGDIENCMLARENRMECFQSGRNSEAFMRYMRVVEEYLKDHGIEDKSLPREMIFTGVEGDKRNVIVFEYKNFIEDTRTSVRSFLRKEGIKVKTTLETNDTEDPYKKYRLIFYITGKNGKTYTNKALREVIKRYLDEKKVRFIISIKDESFFAQEEEKN